MEYEISDKYPVPGTYQEVFPFSKLEAGQSFYVPGEAGQSAKIIQSRIWAAFKRWKDERNITGGYHIVTRTATGDEAAADGGNIGVRVWRLP